jgi:hypothetical protein
VRETLRPIRLRTLLRRFKRPWLSPRYLVEDYRCAQLARVYQFSGGFHRICHFYIRKTGGTSLNHLLLSLEGRPGAKTDAAVCREPYRLVVVNGRELAMGVSLVFNGRRWAVRRGRSHVFCL